MSSYKEENKTAENTEFFESYAQARIVRIGMEFLSCFSATTTALIGLLTVLISYIIYKYQINHYWKTKNIPCTEFVPLLGYAYQIMRGKGFHEVDGDIYRKYGKVIGTYEGTKPVLFVSDPELLRDILVKDFHIFSNRRDFKSGNPIIDSFITLLKDDEWKRVRSLISPTFTTGKLKGMMHLVGDCAILSTENFLKSAESEDAVECKRLFGNYTLDVIASVAFGTKLDSHNDLDNAFVSKARSVFNRDVSIRSLLPILAPRLAKLLGIRLMDMDFFIELVNQIIEQRKQTKEVRNDFLQLMMQKLDGQDVKADASNGHVVKKRVKVDDKVSIDSVKPLPSELDWSEATENDNEIKDHVTYSKKTLSINELIAQSVLFFLAGYDTTATTLSMVCYNLAHNHEAQKKVISEVDEIWKKSSAVEAVTSSETRYIDAVIKETLRLYPPAVRLERMTGEDYTLGNTGYVISKGVLMAIPVYAIHRDPEYFSDPDDFIPERFLPENISSVNPFTYLPFGGGPRNCVAMRLALMEVKINLIYLLREVQFDTCPETKSPPDFYNGNALLQPKAVHLKVTRRNKAV